LGVILLACCTPAFALNPDLDVSQYSHTAWKVRDGFTRGVVTSIVQMPDGYLWLGTEFGLLRFDGVRTVPWQPPPNQDLPSSNITTLLAARDGTLWIGTRKGLASWKNGKLTRYAEFEGKSVPVIREDHDGAVWAGAMAFPPPGNLCVIRTGSVKCYGQDGSLGYGTLSLYEDRKGNLWESSLPGLRRWLPGPPKLYPMPREPDGVRFLGQDADGAILIGMLSGIKRFLDGKTEEVNWLPKSIRQLRTVKMLRDRNGGVWIGTLDRGVVHVHQGITDIFSMRDGLSGEDARDFLEDREGSVWIATEGGIDRFRDFAVNTFSENQGLSQAIVGSVLADRDGSVWFGTYDGLDKWSKGQMTIYREQGNRQLQGATSGAAGHANVREINGPGLPKRAVESLFQDGRGRVWVPTVTGVGYLENDRVTSVSQAAITIVHAMAEDTKGNLWIANQEAGLVRVAGEIVVERIPWATLGPHAFACSLAADPTRGGLWIGFCTGGVAYFSDGQVHATYTTAEGLGPGVVRDFRFDHDGTLWIATEGGLSRLKNSHVATLTSKNGLPCDPVDWTLEDDARSIWLETACGLVRIARSELDAWGAAADQGSKLQRIIQTRVFDSSDGVRSRAEPGGYSPHSAKSADGRLWFTTTGGVSVVDPRHLPSNKLPPPVYVESVKIGGKETMATGEMELSHWNTDIEIAYTALSLTNPDRVFFRYKLDGEDKEWHGVGTRRQAYYTNLAPGKYRFQVMACNNDGVWNHAGAAWSFTIVPAFYQTPWFQGLYVVAAVALMWLVYRLRMRQLSGQFSMRLEERVNERTRIARDLHDTMLQSFQGALMQFHSLASLLEDRPDVREKLERIVEQASAAVTEGRNAVQGLRSSTMIANDLARALNSFGEELAPCVTGENPPKFLVRVKGDSRDLPPLVRDEAYRIGCEALRNAFSHAQARRVEVEIRYDRRQFVLRVEDDGKGIDPKVLAEGGRAGHHGLPGMRERAELVRGKLALRSGINSGTEVELTIPAAVAYAKPKVRRRSMSSGKGS
jgi:signal transduction histidine kinase/ligand-binding sensor domain-containing protein